MKEVPSGASRFVRPAPLLGEIYEAALRPARWAVVLQKFVGRFSGTAAALRTFDAMPQTGGLWFTHGIDQRGLDEYARHFHERDIWESSARARGMLAPGTVFNGDMLLPRAKFLASDFYRDFLRRLDICEVLGFVLHDGATAPIPLSVLMIFRGPQQRLFGPTELGIARPYVPHLARALEMNFRAAELRRRDAVNRVMLERFAPPLAYFRRDGTLLTANDAAHALFADADGLTLEDERLVAGAPSDDEALQQLINAVNPGELGIDALRIGRPSGKMPYVVVPIALGTCPEDPPDAREAHLALILHDPDAASSMNLDTLARLYRLTRAEMRMVRVLLAHGSAKSIFRNTELNRNTVRSQLKSVYEKTGTSAQAELVRLALTVAMPRYA